MRQYFEVNLYDEKDNIIFTDVVQSQSSLKAINNITINKYKGKDNITKVTCHEVILVRKGVDQFVQS